MVLDNFRSVDIFWNHSKIKINKALRVASSDDRGRKLVVQVYDDHIQKNMSGVALRLHWKNTNKTSGFHDFDLIDAETGIYEIFYPKELLENRGSVKAWLHITDSVGSVTSEFFIISVFEGVDVAALEGSDALGALTDALIQINQYQTNIDSILENLEAEYGPMLEAIKTQFDDVLADVTIDSELIAARSSNSTGKSYATAGNRLDAIEERQILTDLNNFERFVGKLSQENGIIYLDYEELI